MAISVTVIGDTVGLLAPVGGIAEAVVDFHLRPDIEFAFFAPAVGIAGAGKSRVIA